MGKHQGQYRLIDIENQSILTLSILLEWIRPRICDDARSLVEKHRALGDVLILTTATNHFTTELTAYDLAIKNLIAIETESVDGIFTGQTVGVLNMRAGKVVRLTQWLIKQGWAESLIKEATFYSDSINDLPLLSAVGNPVAVDPDLKLAREVAARGWTTIQLRRNT